MNGTLNEPQLPTNGLWYFDVCEKEMNKSRLRHNNTNTRIHREKYGIIVKEYEFSKPEIDEIDYVLDNFSKD